MGDDTGNCFNEFQQIVERGKLGMMELVAMHLRKEGVYTCRTLSFAGCKVTPLHTFPTFLPSFFPPFFSLFSYSNPTNSNEHFITPLLYTDASSL